MIKNSNSNSNSYQVKFTRKLVLALLILPILGCLKYDKKLRPNELSADRQDDESQQPNLNIIFVKDKKQFNVFGGSVLRKADTGKFGNEQLKPTIRSNDLGDEVDIEIQNSNYVSINSKKPDDTVNKAKPIFYEEPSIEHIKQTPCFTGLPSLDCPFLSALSTTINLDASILKNLIYDDVDGGKIYVKLWDWKKGEYIYYEMKKQRDLDGGTFRYKYTQNGKLWTHLFERAMDRHLVKMGESGFPIEKKSAINPQHALWAILGEEFEISNAYNYMTDITTNQLDYVVGGVISNMSNMLPPLKDNHSYGIVGIQKEPPGFLLYDSLDPATANKPVFLPLSTFNNFKNGRLVMRK